MTIALKIKKINQYLLLIKSMILIYGTKNTVAIKNEVIGNKSHVMREYPQNIIPGFNAKKKIKLTGTINKSANR